MKKPVLILCRAAASPEHLYCAAWVAASDLHYPEIHKHYELTIATLTINVQDITVLNVHNSYSHRKSLAKWVSAGTLTQSLLPASKGDG